MPLTDSSPATVGFTTPPRNSRIMLLDGHPPAGGTSGSTKVVFLMTHTEPGGVEEIWLNLAAGLSTRGSACSLLALYPHPGAAKESPWRCVAPQRPCSVAAVAALIRDLTRLLQEEQPDVIFTAMPAANVVGPIAAHIARGGTRTVVSHHTPIGTYNPMLRLADGMSGLLPAVAAVIGVSDTVKASLSGRPAPYLRKCITIHNALPPAIEDLLEQLGAQHRRERATSRKVVATGRLVPQKNYPILLRAAAELRDAEVEVIGAGPELEALTEMSAKLGVSGHVRFLGRHPRQQALARLAEGDIFVQPSLFEGHSLGLLEAARLGLPLVVSDVPVQIEGITAPDGTRCGIAVGVHDHAGLAREIQRLLDDPAHYRNLSALSRRLAASSSFAAQLDAYEALLPTPAGAARRGVQA
jgi:glycosyltransferase involved in cell wall biosynthesis